MMVTAMKAGQRRGRSPVEYRGNLYIRTSVCPYVRPSARPYPLRPIRGRPRPLRGLLIGLDQCLRGLHLPLRGLGLPLIGLRGGTCGRTYVRTDVWMYRFPLYSTGLRPLRFPLGPLPKNLVLAVLLALRGNRNCSARLFSYIQMRPRISIMANDGGGAR